MTKVIGIDTGGTLTKLAYINQEGELTVEVFPSNEMELVKEWLERHPQVDEIGVFPIWKEDGVEIIGEK